MGEKKNKKKTYLCTTLLTGSWRWWCTCTTKDYFVSSVLWWMFILMSEWHLLWMLSYWNWFQWTHCLCCQNILGIISGWYNIVTHIALAVRKPLLSVKDCFLSSFGYNSVKPQEQTGKSMAGCEVGMLSDIIRIVQGEHNTLVVKLS